MNKDAAGRGTGIFEVVECVVEDGGDVFGGGIAKPESLVVELAAEVVGAGGADAVEHVGYPAPPQRLSVPGHHVAAEEHVIRHTGALAVGGVRGGSGGGGRGVVIWGEAVVGSGAGPLVGRVMAGDGEGKEGTTGAGRTGGDRARAGRHGAAGPGGGAPEDLAGSQSFILAVHRRRLPTTSVERYLCERDRGTTG